MRINLRPSRFLCSLPVGFVWILVAVYISFAVAPVCRAANGSWVVDANGAWNTAGNWAGAVIADGSGFTAFFTNNITVTRSISLGTSSRTIGHLVIGDADMNSAAGWTFSRNTAGLSLNLAAGTTPTITVTNLAAGSIANLRFNLSGTQGFIKQGPGILQLGGGTAYANSYSGVTTVNGGSLVAATTSAGEIMIPGNLVINSGGSFTNLSDESIANAATVTINTNGAFVLGTTSARTETVANLILAGGVILGHSSSSLVLTTNADVQAGAIYARMGGAAGLTKSTAGEVSLAANNSFTGDTRLQAGTLKLLDVNALGSSTVDMDTSDLGTFIVADGSPYNLGGLKGSRDLSLLRTNGGSALIRLGWNNQTTTYAGNLGPSSASALEKYGNGTLFLNGTNACSVSVFAGTLGGNGSFAASFDVISGALSPGHSIGGMSFSSLNIADGGTVVMETDKNAGTNDFMGCSATLHYGGTLVISNLTASFAANDSFKLFNAANYTGAFTNVVPATPGNNLTWDLSSLTNNGVLKVIGPGNGGENGPRITSLVISGNNAIISGTNGPATSNYFVLSSMDIGVAISNWPSLQTNQFDGNGNFSATNVYFPGETVRFYTIQVHP